MVFDVIIREKTTGNVISLKNVTREYLSNTFQDRIKQLWLNENVLQEPKPKRKVTKKIKPFKEPEV